MRSIHWLAAATIGLGAVAGCGGSEISKSSFIKKGNAICKKGDAELNKATGKLSGSSSKDEVLKAIKDDVLPNIQGQLDDLKDLGYPKGDKAKLDAIYSKAQAALDKLKDDPESMVTATSDPFADINKGFNDYGLSECGSSS